MTRRQLFITTLIVMGAYVIALGMGIVLRIVDPDLKGLIYSTYKDLIPLLIAVPAAYLAYSFQRRNNYVQALRKLWSDLIAAVQEARTYTYSQSTTFEQYSKVLSKLSMVIEEARGVFLNIKAKETTDGYYPFEPIKEIYNDIEDLGFGDKVTKEKKTKVRHEINARWKLVRSQLLREFDRDVPTYHYTWYTAKVQSARAYTELGDCVAQQVAPADGSAAASQPQNRG